jgi:hypothetical protein
MPLSRDATLALLGDIRVSSESTTPPACMSAWRLAQEVPLRSGYPQMKGG